MGLDYPRRSVAIGRMKAGPLRCAALVRQAAVASWPLIVEIEPCRSANLA